MDVTRHADGAALLSAAAGMLLQHEAENNLILGLASGPWNVVYAATAVQDGAVLGVALMTEGQKLVLGRATDLTAVDVLVADALAAGVPVPGIIGSVAEAERAAAALTVQSGAALHVHVRLRIFQLERVIAPRPASGAPRPMQPDDLELVAGWLSAFDREALGGDGANGPASAARWLASDQRKLTIWQDGGQAVSCAGISGRTPNGARIGAVYTPPALRGRGYASAVVAAVSQAELDAGRRFCFLYTDLANPTSNHIYQALGYRPVADALELRVM